jgi:hypothetical protein
MSLSSCYAIKLTQVKFPQAEDRKRKRLQEDEAPLPSTAPSQKRLRTSPPRSPIEDTIGENTAVGVSGKEINSLKYWRTPEGRGIRDVFSPEDTSDIKDSIADPVTRWMQGKPWPKEYFEQESTMNPLLKRKTSSSSLSKQSEMSDGSVREGKNPAAKSRLYEKNLAAAGIYMGGGPGITNTCRALCKSLLAAEQPLPPDSLFRDDRFEKTCERLRNENEAKVIRDISPLLVPSVEVLCAYGEEYLESMVDHVNQKWYGCVPIVTGPVPQPDYSAGCKETIFTKGQLRKLEPFVRGWKGTPFLATAWMYFPYLTMEVKCGNEGLNIADRQNAHSSSVAVKQVVDLYRQVSRQQELNRKVLAFSVSHDQEAVRIYGHYPVIDGDQTSVYRHTIKKFDITNEDGKDKWTTYIFTRNLYDIYGPIHFERLRSAADQLPDPLSDQHQSQQSDPKLTSQPNEEESQSDIVDSQDPLQSAPSSQTSQPSFKKPRSKYS